jgi:hypothetical protein
MAGRESERRYRGRRAAAAVGATVALYGVADYAASGPVSEGLGISHDRVDGSIKEADSYASFLGIIDQYTTAGPAIENAVNVLSKEQFDEQYYVNTVTTPEGIRTRAELRLRGLDQHDVPLDLLQPAITVDQTIRGQLLFGEKLRISAHLDENGEPIVQDHIPTTPEQRLTPDQMQTAADNFVSVPGFKEAPWDFIPAIPEDPTSDTLTVQKIFVHDGDTVTVQVNSSGQTSIAVREGFLLTQPQADNS